MGPRAPETEGSQVALRMPLAPSLLEPVNLAEGTKDPGKVGSSVGMESLLTLALPSTPRYTPRGCQEGRAEKADARGQVF